MSSSEISEWKVYFQLEAADREAARNGGGSGGGTTVTTAAGTTRVE